MAALERELLSQFQRGTRAQWQSEGIMLVGTGSLELTAWTMNTKQREQPGNAESLYPKSPSRGTPAPARPDLQISSNDITNWDQVC